MVKNYAWFKRPNIWEIFPSTELSKNNHWIDMSSDLLPQRAIFFQKVHRIRQAHGFYGPELIGEIIRIFGT